MIEKSLMICLLELLDEFDGNSVPENTLMNEITYRATRAPTSDQIHEHLREAKSRNWAETEIGLLKETRWRRTPRTAGALSDLRQS